jgi:hypothetical protein
MKANRILYFTLFTLSIVWGKPRRGGGLASLLIGPPIVNLAPTDYTSCNAANLAIWAPTRTLCALHQSTWLSVQPFTPTRRVGCMCVVPRTVPNSSWVVLAWSARVVASWGALSNKAWTRSRKHATFWGWLLSSHFFTDPAQNFFLATSITSWASHAFPKMQSLVTVFTRLYYNNTYPHAKCSKGNLPNFASMMDVLVVFCTPSRDLRNPRYTTSIASLFLESTQTSQA